MVVQLDERRGGAARFNVPIGSDATEPPERRGLERDGVRLLVARDDAIEHTTFRRLPDHLDAGDLVVINTSRTLASALVVERANRGRALIHVACALDDGSWVVEVRSSGNDGPAVDVGLGETFGLAGGTRLTIEASYPLEGVTGSRLWRAHPRRRIDLVEHLTDHGQPIRYRYLRAETSLDDVQTVYADEPGSAEMPSAGRPFTDRLLTRLAMRGVAVAPIVLHTGLSSPEKHEPPAAERFRVPVATARLVNAARAGGGRVVAIGTTVVRALETVADDRGVVMPGAGWTHHVVGQNAPIRAIDGLISGLHEPHSSHLVLLETVAGADLVARAYDAAVEARYRWHEFGDSMLLLP